MKICERKKKKKKESVRIHGRKIKGGANTVEDESDSEKEARVTIKETKRVNVTKSELLKGSEKGREN